MPDTAIRTLLAAVPLPALFLGEGDRIAGLNARAEALFGQAEARPFITAIRQPSVLEAVAACRAKRTPQIARYLTKEAAQDVIYRAHCAYVEAGPATGVLMSFEDVTNQEQIGQMRRDFVANVSHELRTPLTALMGFIETLQGPAKDDPIARERFLAIMDTEAQRMNRLVRDLLSLSQVEEMERMRPDTQLDLRELLLSCLRNLAPVAARSDTTLRTEMGENPVRVAGDPDQLRQVFNNLIENAIKYGGRPGIVTLRLTGPERDQALRADAVRVDVQDNGQGIDEIHIPRLTERFYRVDSHRSREMGGTGLGLAIVKHIISRHRGRLRIDSTPGQGSTFTVSLPVSL
ncbi:MAG: ATP-binding protein [Paracoccaceae bacterium]|uniref:ATP-binding protein n=1 Tax=Seohaeicola saemankumensis TaxID=481181 RepID=UPI001E34882C|nr:ATP-binding protein [Seohaeicola saemankumensis]MCD1626890.1 two-component sensor histidine kinase [Seohaeicola saemankumensis]